MGTAVIIQTHKNLEGIKQEKKKEIKLRLQQFKVCTLKIRRK